MNDRKQQKHKLRMKMLKVRDAISAERHAEWSNAICQKTIENVLQPLAKNSGRMTLFSYVPYRSELDVRPIAEWAWREGHRVVFPRVVPEKHQMELRVADSFDEMEANRWGILEPRDAAPVWTKPVHAVIVPGVAFDRTGARLGYGGGYYDRWLEQQQLDRNHHVPLLVAPSFERQIVDNVPSEAHDIKVDVLITEKS